MRGLAPTFVEPRPVTGLAPTRDKIAERALAPFAPNHFLACSRLRPVRAMSEHPMSYGFSQVPTPINDPIRAYLPGSEERASIKTELERQASASVEVPMYIGGARVTTGDLHDIVMPHDHQHVLGRWHAGTADHARQAVEAAEAAKDDWANLPWEDRAAIFLKAAHLLKHTHRDRFNAATMLNQSKVLFQAEIDAACELVDFWNFNVHYMARIYGEQPPVSPEGQWNRLEHRPLDGFVFAVSPFNFTSIAANIPTAPALMGNTVVWKPAPTAMLGAYYIMELLEEAGLPKGVINMVAGPPAEIGDAVLNDPRLAGIHFTGSTATFEHLWQQVATRLPSYRSYPRLVGETGGKDFVFAHPSADPTTVATALARGAFEYQGQKCSAASRAYIPRSMWPTVRAQLEEHLKTIKVGDVRDFQNLMGAVIDARAYAKHVEAIGQAKGMIGDAIEEVLGGGHDDSKGWFVQPTVIVANDAQAPTMTTELFGPILTVHPYEDADFEATLELCDKTGPYALTGCIMARDRGAVATAVERLRFSAGNFYVNDKPTGAVVGQQPFGGSRKSGTNDKAGAILNLLRWVSPRTIKETFEPPTTVPYPYMSEP